MADRIVVFWRDIPAQVIIKKGRQTAKRELSLRFTEAIDMCAMRSGAAGTDDYLAEWRKAEPIAVSDDLEAEADRAAAELEAAYDREKLVALVKTGGREVA
ncbi:virulence factor [Neorhizobium sp. T25_27]|uniref:virulence factor n=1 Tax=Neorhizobium sp. T25_27 TaxID=2093831 RepID=UPI000CFA6F59|nr:virulence factor [Neorhizobium sp. T25_27]